MSIISQTPPLGNQFGALSGYGVRTPFLTPQDVVQHQLAEQESIKFENKNNRMETRNINQPPRLMITPQVGKTAGRLYEQKITRISGVKQAAAKRNMKQRHVGRAAKYTSNTVNNSASKSRK